jgi:nucleoside-diphosphate-sugar epimerase
MSRVIPLFVHNIYYGRPIVVRGGRQLIDFVHIDDVVGIMSRAMQFMNCLPDGTFEVFNLCTGNAVSMPNIVRAIEHSLKRHANVIYEQGREYEVSRFVGCTKRLQTVLGVGNFKLFEDGLDQYTRQVVSVGFSD